MTPPHIKLNLGCGENRLPGYINVDKFGTPDVRHDLETFPWPWEDNSVDEINMSHVLEHLGGSSDTYLKIIQEMYRICVHDARIHITVPHPRHIDFITDPTHVRPITVEGLWLFSKSFNRKIIEAGGANSPLGMYLDVDFEVVDSAFRLEDEWLEKYKTGELSEKQINQAIKRYNNVVKEIQIELKVIKGLLETQK